MYKSKILSPFRNEIGRLSAFGTSAQQTFSYPIINILNGNILNVLDLTYNQIWAEEFYKLRHRIIHGYAVVRSDFEFNDLLGMTTQYNPHFYIAVNFYMICLLNKLRDMGYVNVPRFIIDPHSSSTLVKSICGIPNEIFKMIQVF